MIRNSQFGFEKLLCERLKWTPLEDINDDNYLLPLLKSNLEIDLQFILIGKSFRSKPLDDLEKKAYKYQERYIKYMISENYIEGLPKNNIYISVSSDKNIQDVHNEILRGVKGHVG